MRLAVTKTQSPLTRKTRPHKNKIKEKKLFTIYPPTAWYPSKDPGTGSSSSYFKAKLDIDQLILGPSIISPPNTSWPTQHAIGGFKVITLQHKHSSSRALLLFFFLLFISPQQLLRYQTDKTGKNFLSFCSRTANLRLCGVFSSRQTTPAPYRITPWCASQFVSSHPGTASQRSGPLAIAVISFVAAIWGRSTLSQVTASPQTARHSGEIRLAYIQYCTTTACLSLLIALLS